MGKPVIILGVHSLGKLALEIFQKNDIVVYGLLSEDKALQGTEVSHVPVLSSIEDEQYLGLLGKTCEAFVAVEQHVSRQKLISTLSKQRKIIPINAIHPLAAIASTASIGYGNLVNVGASLGYGTALGSHCTVHAHVAIEHEAIIKDFVQIGTGSIIGAQAVIEEHVFIGLGATIITGIQVGAGARIGAGSVVLDHVHPGEVVLGNPAKPVQY
ncbi:MAG: DapH/DapD/GlmU-related protein [Bacteroidota bacterium]